MRSLAALVLLTTSSSLALTAGACSSDVTPNGPTTIGGDASSEDIGDTDDDASASTSPRDASQAALDAGSKAKQDAAAPHTDAGSAVSDGSVPDAALIEAGSSCPPGGCSVSLVLDWSEGTYPRVLTSDGTTLFMSDPSEADVNHAPVSGGNGSIVGGPYDPQTDTSSFVIDATNIYACGGSLPIPHVVELWTGSKTAGHVPGQILASVTSQNNYSCSVADDGAEIFFFSDVSTLAVSKSTHAVRTVATSPPYVPDFSVADAANLYLAVGRGVLAVSKAGGAYKTLWTATGFTPHLRNLTLIGSALLWIDGDDGIVWRYPLPSGPATALNSAAPTPGTWPLLAADANAFYWSHGDLGKIYTAPIAGGAPTVAVSGLPHIRGIAIDATHLFFSIEDRNRPRYHRAVGSMPR